MLEDVYKAVEKVVLFCQNVFENEREIMCMNFLLAVNQHSLLLYVIRYAFGYKQNQAGKIR